MSRLWFATSRYWAALLVVCLAPPRIHPAEPARAPEALFLQRVLPVLQERCLSCHGRDEEKIKSGLDLRTRASALEGGDSLTPALVPGHPTGSPLYLAITRHDPVWEPMPPKDNDALTPEQISDVRDWIAAGAPWPDEPRAKQLGEDRNWSSDDGVLVPTSGGLSDDWTHRRYKPETLWAYQPLKKPTVPSSPPRGPARSGKGHESSSATPAGPSSGTPIDAFIDAKLGDLAPAPRADRRTLIRRVTFGLTGLPPSPQEVQQFLADPAPDADAFANVVERLLASPHYGEQMARHWLDIVRYADSSGFANDYNRGNAWRYRDYVVRAFNADKPYDQFVREQLAGDELAPDDPAAIIATSFLRMGPWELTGMEVAKVARQRFLDDVTDTVGQVLLAHPLQCARCHDHKFDPVPTRDYYSFQSIFGTTQLAERAAAFLPEENTGGFGEKKYVDQRAEHYRRELARIDDKSIAAARAWYADHGIDSAAFERALADAAARQLAGRAGVFSDARAALLRDAIPEDQIPPKGVGLTLQDFGHQRIARKGLERLKWELERYEPIALAVYSGRTPELKSVSSPMRMPPAPLTQGELERTHILVGGDPFANGEPVTPGVLSAAANLGGMEAAAIPAEVVGRRAALAAWITSPTNPLTARVMVNRIWQWHFGRAIAGNPNNFGATGKPPTHPELLDWLAVAFIESGWSVKAMHRLILRSAAYARRSSHPAEHYAAFLPRRLTAEELRDTMLAVSGELNRTGGGIPARPEINPEAALQPRQLMGAVAEALQPSPLPEERHRRSLYALKLRGLRDPFMEVFNSPSPDLSCEAREASTVTPQVFSMFNSQATLARTVAWAARLTRETSTREEAVARAFALAFSRPPTAEELSDCLRHWSAMSARHGTVTVPRASVPRQVEREAVEEFTGERFTFVETLEAAADFVPDLQLADLPPATRGLADLCLVLLNTNEFVYIY